jgi:hypothetical protein
MRVGRFLFTAQMICDDLGVPRELIGLSYGEPDAYGGDSTVADLPGGHGDVASSPDRAG